MIPPRAVVLTGGRGDGKTTLCLAIAALSPRFTGLVSPPLFDAAVARVGFSARCIATAEEWVLARSDVDLGGPRYGRFSFSSAGIGRAVDCLRGILRDAAAREEGPAASPAAAPPGPADSPVVVIDEIGPLEVERGEGLTPVLPLLAAAGDLLLVVRPSLVDRVETLVPRHRREVIVVTSENRAALPAILLQRFD